jgi:hypothetical protein
MSTPDISTALDQAAEKIRFAEDYYSRQCAIDEFRMICRDDQSFIDPTREAVKRNVVLINPLQSN